jgi:hypothetical protein
MKTNLNKYWIVVGIITFIIMVVFAFLTKELETFVYEDVASANSFEEDIFVDNIESSSTTEEIEGE